MSYETYYMGRTSYGNSETLIFENNDITVTDKNPDLVRRLTNSLDVAGVTGLVASQYFRSSRSSDADKIMVMLSDEVNMVVCQVAILYFRYLKIARKETIFSVLII